MDRLAELLQETPDFATMSNDDLAAYIANIDEAMAAANEGDLNRDATALMAQGAKVAADAVAEQVARRSAAAEIRAEADQAMQSLRDAIAAGAESLDDAVAAGEGGEGEGSGEGGETVAAAAEGEAAAAPAVEGAPAAEGGEAAAPAEGGDVSATTATTTTTARRDVVVPGRNAPKPTSKRGPTLIASGEVRSVPLGHNFPSMEAVHAAMWEKWDMMRSSPDGVNHYLCTVDYKDQYDELHTIKTTDPFETVDQVLRAMRADSERDQALVASGGIPGPSEPRYEQITYGQASRPLRDALPSFRTTRGRIIFNESPTLADILSDDNNNSTSAAIGRVTAAQDLAGGSGATKNIQEISAPTSSEAEVEAETMRFSQGNFADRFLPERTAAFMRLGQVAFARHNEALRLVDIKAGSTKQTDTPAKYGAFRDLKAQLLGTVEELSDRLRDYDVKFRVLLPAYVPAMLAVDMTRQQPGDSTWNEAVSAMRSAVEGWSDRVNVSWLLDSIRGRMLSTPSGQSPRTAGFDADVEWCIFPEGTWIFLDGGTLDLGIIRDSVTSQTNKFQTFYENWEGVAKITPVSLWITSSLCANGLSQIAKDVAVCSPQGS